MICSFVPQVIFESLVYWDVQCWVSRSIRMTLKAVAVQLRAPAPCCNLPGDPIFLNQDILTLKSQDESWHCTFTSREKSPQHKNLPPQHLMHLSVLLRVTSSTVNSVPMWNVYTASHLSQPPRSLIKMPFKALFWVCGFKSAFDFGGLPSGFSGVLPGSFGTEISLDFGFREQMLRECLEHNKVVRWCLWAV